MCVQKDSPFTRSEHHNQPTSGWKTAPSVVAPGCLFCWVIFVVRTKWVLSRLRLCKDVVPHCTIPLFILVLSIVRGEMILISIIR